MKALSTAPQRGFTLIEMVIVTAIAGILAAIAYPSFAAPLYKARRLDGISALLQLQMSQERWRSGHASYASLAELGPLGERTTSPQNHYALSVDQAEATRYTLVARATGAQSGDTACRVMKLQTIASQTTYHSGPDERTANASADNNRCWGL